MLGFEHPHLIRAAERLGRWHLGRQVHDPGLRRKLEARVRYIMGCLRLVARSGARSIEVRPQAQRRFNDWVQEKSGGSVWLKGGCASWYLDSDGVNRALWPASTVTFWLRMRRVRRADFCLQGAAA